MESRLLGLSLSLLLSLIPLRAWGVQVVGEASLPGELQHAFLWTDGAMTDLGTLVDPTNPSWAMAIGSGLGHVVGQTESADGHFHAFRWTDSGGMVDLGTLMAGQDTVAYGIDDSGDGDRVVRTSWARGFALALAHPGMY